MEVSKVSNRTNIQMTKPKAVAFKGASPEKLLSIADTVKKNYLPTSLKVMEKLKCLKGELGGIVITAIGTGLVAPFFIAFNPLSKTDSDTKKYTAMRQPVSAVLAIFIQAGLTLPFGKMLEKAVNEGKLGDNVLINKVELNSEAYLKTKVKKELKAEGKLNGISKKEAEERIMERVHDIQSTQRQKLESSLRNNGKITIGSKDITPQKLSEIIRDTFKDYSKSLNEELIELKGKDVTFKVKRSQILVKNEKELRKNLKEILTWDNKVDYRSRIREWEKTARANKNPELLEIYKEIRQKDCLDLVQSRAKNTIRVIDKFKTKITQAEVLKNNESKFKEILKVIINDTESDNLVKKFNNYLDTLNIDKKIRSDLVADMAEYKDADSQKAFAKNLIEKINKLKKLKTNDEILECHQRNYYALKIQYLEHKVSVISNALKSVKDDMTPEATKDFLSNINKKIDGFCEKDVFKDTVKMYEKLRDNAFDINKNIKSAVVATLIFLPITCTTLNWVYPRFMDIFFPSLAQNKKNKEMPNIQNKLDVKEAN